MLPTCFRTVIGAALALAVVTAPAHAELSSAADPSWVTNGEIKGTALIGDTVYVGGTFDYVGPFTGNGVVLGTGSGVRDAGWPIVEGGQVHAAAPDGSGGWFIGGDFDKVGGQSRLNIAHIRPDKTIDLTWNPGTNNTVRTMVVMAGYLYIGGDFTTVAGSNRTRLAALSASTGVPRNDWTPVASGSVLAMGSATVSGTSYLVIGGAFTSLNGNSHRRLGRVRASDGASDEGWTPSVLDDQVNALAVAGTSVYVGGSFDEFDDPNAIPNFERHGLGAFDLSTGVPTAWTVDAGGGFVNALLSDGVRLYAGGGFTSIGGTGVAGLAAIDRTSGVVDAGWTPDPQVTVGFPKVYTLAVQGSNLVVGGSFTSIGGSARDDLAIVDRAGTGAAVGAFVPNVMRDENTEVTAVAVSGSDLYVGGDFRSVGGLDRGYLAAFAVADGSATSWNPVADAPVQVLAKRGTTVYAGGSFATVAGQAHANLAAIDANGAAVAGGVPDTNGPVYSMAVDDANAQLVVGGTFTTVEGQAHQRLAAIDLANGHVLGWAPTVDGSVDAIGLTATRAYIGGNFTTVGGLARPNLAAVRRDTGAAENWNPQPAGSIDAIQVSGTGPVFIGGDFGTLGGSVTRVNLAAIDQGSAAPTAWRSDATGGAVHALWLRDATLYVGGEFTSIDGTARNRLAAVEVSDGDALAWNPNVSGTSAVVEEIHVVPGSFDGVTVKPGKVYVGGRFTQIGLLPRGGYAGFNETTEPPSNTAVPALTGTPSPGSTLTCSNGSWSGAPTGFTRQWLRAGAPIGGQSGTTYVVQDGDLGLNVVCRVTASNNGGGTSADSAARLIQPADTGGGGGGGGGGGATAPSIVSAPAIGGTARVGSSLTCSDGTWSGTPAPTFGRVWRVAGVERGTSIGFTPEDGDAGKSVSCTVTASNTSGTASATSSAVTIAPRAPAALTAPSVTGNAVVGSTLACTDGTWTGSPSLSRQWLRGGSPVAGAAGTTYAVTANDAGRTLRCRVTAKNATGSVDVDSNEVTVTTPGKGDTPATPKPARKPAIAAAALKLAAGGVSVKVTCYAACRGKLAIANGKTRLGSANLVRAKAGVVTVRVPLTRAARQLIVRRGSLRVQVVATLTGGGSVTRAVTIRT